MSNFKKNDEYYDDFSKIIEMIENRRANAYRKVNEELIELYWDIGHFVSEQIQNNKWGSKVVDSLVVFINDKYPTLKGFNRRSIYRMKQFYETYKDDEIVSPLVTQLNWTNNLLILSKTHSKEEREFYIKLTIKNNYSKTELNRQLSSSYYERYMLSGEKSSLLIEHNNDEDFPNTKILDLYSLEFLDLPNGYSEVDLRKAIIKNLKKFILEIGKSFTFVGEEYKVQVGKEDFFIDLLFYNRDLSCLVAFELKVGKFKPEYISKMDFYLEALDQQEKKNNENPSVGIILCTDKDEKVVEYAMRRSMSPTMVAKYKLKLIDKELLENKLREISMVVEKATNIFN